MSQLKNRLQALTMLDRAFSAINDDELAALVATLPDDHREALDELCGAHEGGFTDTAARTLAMRATAARGRMNGGLEQIATLVTDPCLAKCIDLLGKNSDNPTEPQLLEITPALVEEFGLPATRLMLASSIAGEAAASAMLTRVLKHDETLALPPAERTDVEVLPARTADEETKAKRKALKEKKQAEARKAREQQQKARHR
ncbi:MAG: hypothetical protein Q7V88_08785 [Actinomycetota bacterium]|nr:hypothetical protein [Actinomycetota bacterium]